MEAIGTFTIKIVKTKVCRPIYEILKSDKFKVGTNHKYQNDTLQPIYAS